MSICCGHSLPLYASLFGHRAEPRALLKKKSNWPLTDDMIAAFSGKSQQPLRQIMLYVTGLRGGGARNSCFSSVVGQGFVVFGITVCICSKS